MSKLMPRLTYTELYRQLRNTFLGVLATTILYPGSVHAKTLEEWLEQQEGVAGRKMMENVSPKGTASGSVIASPSKQNPDYYYHWVRDGALVMSAVHTLSLRAPTPLDEKVYLGPLFDFIVFSRLNQLTPTLAGLGEPKFHVDGRAYNDPWGRPQNDSPALRALTLIRFANQLLDDGKDAVVKKYLYDGSLPSASVIKVDLEYTTQSWIERSFDLWEEIRGYHFYTMMTQMAALIEGGKLATRMGDGGAAQYYLDQAKQIESFLLRFRDSKQRIITATLYRDAGADYKYSGLDTSTLLAVLHTHSQGLFAASNEWVLSTANAIEASFESIYPINTRIKSIATAIGRYPEDRYFGGNPWFLTTHAFAEYYYVLIRELSAAGKIEITAMNEDFYRRLLRFSLNKINLTPGDVYLKGQPEYQEIMAKLFEKADAFMARSRMHTPTDGSMSEQFGRSNGFMLSARDLTWSYASFLTAKWAREEAIEALK